MIVGAIELGGTKTLVTLGTGVADYASPVRIETSDPRTTLSAVIRALAELAKPRGEITAIGLASFGPLSISDGRVLDTPKPGWSQSDVAGPVADAFGCPVRCETDVNAAALAEGHWGASKDLENHAYLTIGTGVGVGLVINGHPIHGSLHPEAGHIRLRRQEDNFDGICPWHGDCVEGLIAGPAIAKRCGQSPEGIGDDHPVWRLVGGYAGQLCAILALTTSVERIVIGGGLGSRPTVLREARIAFESDLAGYLPSRDAAARSLLQPATLNGRSGLMGALLLAQQSTGTVLSHSAPQPIN